MLLESWITLLSITYKLELSSIKHRVVREVFAAAEPPDPIRQLELYEKFAVPRAALAPAMRTLVVRDQPLSENEADRLSKETITEIMHMREEYIRAQLKPFGFLKGLKMETADRLTASWEAKI